MVEDKYNLRARPTSPSLVEGLASTHKDMYHDVVVLTGTLEPDPANKKIPRKFGTPVGGAQRCFKKPLLDELNLEHLNAAINHDGPNHVGPVGHPRSAHNLLNYPLPYRSFSSRTNIVKWVGEPLIDKPRYDFFKAHNIVNPWVALKDERIRLRLLAGESPDLEFPEFLASKRKRGKGKRKKTQTAEGSPPLVEVVSHPPADRPVLQTENAEGVSVADPVTAIPIPTRTGQAVPISDEESRGQVFGVDPAAEQESEESEEFILRRRSRRKQSIPSYTSEPPEADMSGRRSIFDSLREQVYKDKPPSSVEGVSGSSAAPPRKKRKLVRPRNSPTEAASAPVAEEAVLQEPVTEPVRDADVPEDQNPPLGNEPVIPDFESAEHRASPPISSPVRPEVTEVKESTSPREAVPEEFLVKPRIAGNRRPINVEDSALGNSRVAHALATAITLPEDARALKAVSNTELEYKSLQCQVSANLYFAEAIARYKQAKKNYKATISEISKENTEIKKTVDQANAEVTSIKNQLSSLQAEHDSVLKSANENKATLESQIKSLQDQLAELSESHKRALNSKKHAVTKARDEERRAAEQQIEALKASHVLDIADAEERGYNECSSDAAADLLKVKDLIYKSGYEFGLTTAGILEGDELFDKLVICPPNLFAQPPPEEQKEDEDENQDAANDANKPN